MTDYHHSDRAGETGTPLRRWAEADHEDNNRAHQAAEALFAPKRQIAGPSTPTAARSAAQARKPRILSAVPVEPARTEAIEAPVNLVPPKRRENIPASHFARIRTWLRYGMTVCQVAELYEVTVADIESVLHKR
jgi:hypothetical protein